MLINSNKEKCPLCKSRSNPFYKDKRCSYFKCTNCMSVFLDRKQLPDSETEMKRYLEHNNDVNDPGYQKFVSPIVSSVLNDFTKKDYGLDYGAGPGPVVAKLLKEKNFQIEVYDPFFHDDKKVLAKKYNYIICCEVIEHFHHPKKEFEKLKNMLLPNGKIYCMTDLYDEEIDFRNWYYKNDQTHVFIYHEKALEWIKGNLNFTGINVDDRLITFSIITDHMKKVSDE